MSIAPTADPAAAPVEPTAAPAPAPVAAPAPEMISVPADQMDSYGRDWHAVMADAKSGREARDNGLIEIAQRLSAEGYTPRQYLAFLDNYEPGQVQAAPQPPATPEAPPQPALTIDQVRETVTGALREDQDKRSQSDLRQAEADHRAKILDEAGYKRNEDGSLTPRRRSASRIWDGCVSDAILDTVPSYASEEVRQNALRGVASPEILAEAERRFKEDMADFGNEAVAAAVTEQEPVPGETLAAGPGGSEPPVAFEDMSPAQQKAAVMKDNPALDE